MLIGSFRKRGDVMEYDLRCIMKDAHRFQERMGFDRANALRAAWRGAKCARQPAPDRYFLLQMKDRWDSGDYEEALRYE